MRLVSVSPSNDFHKYVALVIDDNNREHHIRFGLKGSSDYLHHKDTKRRELYIIRHQKREDWTRSGRLSAGFWSRWILWGNSTSLEKNIAEVRRKYF
jgi:hypothetical protein